MSKKQPSEPFRKVRKQQNPSSENFGTLPHVSEEGDLHSLTVREVAKMLENAGVTRTERSIINWCQDKPNKVPRLDCYFERNDNKYYITPNSVNRVIQEEQNKLKIQRQTLPSETPRNPSETPNNDSEAFGTPPDSFRTLPKAAEDLDNQTQPGNSKELEAEILDLRITNKAKDMFIKQLRESNDSLFKDLKHASYQLGQLETQIKQLQAPVQQDGTPEQPQANGTEKTPEGTTPGEIVPTENSSPDSSSQSQPEEPAHSLYTEPAQPQEASAPEWQETNANP